MRPIKFRAWHKQEQKMCEVSGFFFGMVMFISAQRKATQYTLNSVPLGYVELMQFTGLKDSNGKEIYEGDVLFSHALDISHTNNDYYIADAGVSLPTGSLLFTHVKNDPLKVPVAFNDTGSLEIIGNIHENPELIGENRNANQE